MDAIGKLYENLAVVRTLIATADDRSNRIAAEIHELRAAQASPPSPKHPAIPQGHPQFKTENGRDCFRRSSHHLEVQPWIEIDSLVEHVADECRRAAVEAHLLGYLRLQHESGFSNTTGKFDIIKAWLDWRREQ